MTEQSDKNGNENGQSIDYDAKQADVDKAKQKSHDEDAERLAAEHE